MGRHVHFKCTATLGSLHTLCLDSQERLITEPKREPTKNIAKQADAQDAGFSNGKKEVARDRVHVLDLVAARSKDREEDPGDEGDDGPVAGYASALE